MSQVIYGRNAKGEKQKIYVDDEGSMSIAGKFTKAIFLGIGFKAHFENTSLAGGSKQYIQLKTGDACNHLLARKIVGIGDALKISIYEEPTDITDGDSSIDIYNADRQSDNTPEMTLYDNPTVTDAGSNIIDVDLLPSTKKSGDTAYDESEWFLKENVDYLIEIENIGSNSVNLLIDLLWYEGHRT